MSKDDQKRKEPKQSAARPQLTMGILADVANTRDVLENIRMDDGKEAVERGIKKATDMLEEILARA